MVLSSLQWQYDTYMLYGTSVVYITITKCSLFLYVCVCLPPDPKKQIETQDLAWFAYFGRHLFVLIWTGTTKQNISFKCKGRNSHDHDHLVKIPQYGWTAKYRCKASAFGYGSPGDVTTSVRVSCEMVDVISEHLIWCKHKELANLKISEATFIIWASGEIPQ